MKCSEHPGVSTPTFCFDSKSMATCAICGLVFHNAYQLGPHRRVCTGLPQNIGTQTNNIDQCSNQQVQQNGQSDSRIPDAVITTPHVENANEGEDGDNTTVLHVLAQRQICTPAKPWGRAVQATLRRRPPISDVDLARDYHTVRRHALIASRRTIM